MRVEGDLHSLLEDENSLPRSIVQTCNLNLDVVSKQLTNPRPETFVGEIIDLTEDLTVSSRHLKQI